MNSGRELLSGTGINKRFGGVQALADVTFAINHGEIFGLIGPNGAGKTRVFNFVTGIYTPTAATSRSRANARGLKPHQMAGRGIARTFQNIRLFAN